MAEFESSDDQRSEKIDDDNDHAQEITNFMKNSSEIKK